MKRSLSALMLGLALGLPAWAEMHHAGPGAAMDHAAMTAKLSEGMVKKVDKAQAKLTIRHGPLENLGMPAMTMVFRVKDTSWLDQMKDGEKIRFMADNVNGAMTLVHFEKAK